MVEKINKCIYLVYTIVFITISPMSLGFGIALFKFIMMCYDFTDL